MQSKEFDNLMLGKDAKWADFTDISKVFKQEEKPSAAIIKQAIQKVEVEIPTPTKEAILARAEALRSYGMKESKVRRIIKKEFNIHVF